MNYEKQFRCGCTMIVLNSGAGDIHMCPKHKAAPDMYEALKAIVTVGMSHFTQDDIDNALKALAKAEGDK